MCKYSEIRFKSEWRLGIIKIIGFLYNIDRSIFRLKTVEVGTRSIGLAQLSRLLAEDGEASLRNFK
jgi:hypothetical protein